MQVVFEAAQLRVLGDGLTAAERAVIPSRMTGPELLDVAEHPWVHYHSVCVLAILAANGCHEGRSSSKVQRAASDGAVC